MSCIVIILLPGGEILHARKYSVRISKWVSFKKYTLSDCNVIMIWYYFMIPGNIAMIMIVAIIVLVYINVYFPFY